MRTQLMADSVEITVERWPSVIVVALEKGSPEHKYGMQTELSESADGTEVLRVTQIVGGLLGKWNHLATMSRRYYDVVPAGSRIVQVGDITACMDMQQALASVSTVVVSFQRPELDPLGASQSASSIE